LRKIHVHWLSHVIHDLRGPLFAARGYTKLLIDEKAGGVTVTQRRYLTIILENINKLAVSVNSLQEFPAPEDLDLEIIDLRELLHSIINYWRVQEKTLHLNENIFSGPAPTTGDRAKLSLAVHKLLAATVEFSRSGGTIDLYARREEDEFTMRVSAASGSAEPPAGATALPDIAMPCEILRLHGGSASADFGRAGLYNVTVRLPLITPDSGRARERRER